MYRDKKHKIVLQKLPLFKSCKCGNSAENSYHFSDVFFQEENDQKIYNSTFSLNCEIQSSIFPPSHPLLILCGANVKYDYAIDLNKILTVCPIVKHPKSFNPSIDRWINKCYICKYLEYVSTQFHKRQKHAKKFLALWSNK